MQNRGNLFGFHHPSDSLGAAALSFPRTTEGEEAARKLLSLGTSKNQSDSKDEDEYEDEDDESAGRVGMRYRLAPADHILRGMYGRAKAVPGV